MNTTVSNDANSIQSRRNFLLGLGIGTAALASGFGSAVSKTVQSFFSSLFEDTFNAGKPESYETGKVDGRWKDQYGVWIVRSLDGIFALSAQTPAGCAAKWIEKQQKFHCDCHGKNYYKSGISFKGAADKALHRLKISRTSSGEILVDRNKKFLFEKGEWQLSRSLLPV